MRVTLVDRGSRVLTFADDEIADTLTYLMRRNGVTLRLNELVFDIEYVIDERGNRVRVMLESGKQIVSDAAMYCVGRTGNTESLGLEAVGLEADERGRLSVDEHYQTEVEGIYTVGGVVGIRRWSSATRPPPWTGSTGWGCSDARSPGTAMSTGQSCHRVAGAPPPAVVHHYGGSERNATPLQPTCL